jgi:ABC-2 type transport system ATP-binding protein
MIELKNISKSYGQIQALNGINIKINSSKIYGLLGPNGSGKSTLIKIILKIIEPTKGTVNYSDDNLKNNFFNSVGYLPEERGLFLNSKVIDVLSYFGKLKNLKGKNLKERINYWLERLELKDSSLFQIGQLSKGNQQKVQLITALLHEPKLLILDEPYTGFDPLNQQLLNEIILEYSANEKTIILSTHLMNFVENVCTDVIFLNQGNLLYNGSLKNLFSKHSEETFLLEIEKSKATEQEVRALPYKNLTTKHPALNEIFFEELKNQGSDER